MIPPIRLFLAAGVATSPNFMEEFRCELQSRMESQSIVVESELAHPYGYWSRPLSAQLREAGRDLRRGASGYRESIGGARLLEAIDAHPSSQSGQSWQTVLIGHSAGGTAAVHAAMRLRERSASAGPCLVVMIGSPRFRIPAELREHIYYLYAAGAADPIPRIGAFSGWGIRRQAPRAVTRLPIVGGHADYFRGGEGFRNASGHSNLTITLDRVWTWLMERLIVDNGGDESCE